MSANFKDVKITILKKIEVPDIHKEYATEDIHPVCRKYNEGQEYISRNVQKPEGLCSWVWPILHEKVLFLALGHDYPWTKQRGVEIVCCPDGLHPVLYKLERLDA
jgi:uncharacterized repeat protein (TIGR04076 family)